MTEALVAGGAETFALRLTNKLRALGHGCELLCLNRDLVDPQLVAAHGGQPMIIAVPAIRQIKRVDRLARMLGLNVQLQRRLTEALVAPLLDGYDVIHSNLLGSDLLFASIKQRRPSLRLVSTLHGDYALHELGNVSRAEGRRSEAWPRQKALLKANIDRWVTIAEPQHQLMERLGVAASRLTNIPNGYELSPTALNAARTARTGPFTFAMAARGSIPEKGWEVLIQAFLQVRGDARLCLIGEGEHLGQLHRRYGGDERIRFAGFQADPAVLIAQADLFVLPTTYPAESLPTVVIEALAVGVPVIASDIGEIKGMLRTRHGELAGTILPLTNGRPLLASLVAAMQRYIDQPELLADKKGKTASAFLKFDMNRCAAAYARVYAEVVGAS